MKTRDELSLEEKVSIFNQLFLDLKMESTQLRKKALDETIEIITLESGQQIQYVDKAVIEVLEEGTPNEQLYGHFDTICFLGRYDKPTTKYNGIESTKHFMGTDIENPFNEDYTEIGGDTADDIRTKVYIVDNLSEKDFEITRMGKVARKGLQNIQKRRK